MYVKPFTTVPGHLKFQDSSGLDVRLLALVKGEEVLRVGCELSNNKNLTNTELGMCAVNVLYHL